MNKVDVKLILDLISRRSNNIPVWDESGYIFEHKDTVSLYASENSVLLEELLSYLILFKVCYKEGRYLKFNPETLSKISLLDLLG